MLITVIKIVLSIVGYIFIGLLLAKFLYFGLGDSFDDNDNSEDK